MHFYKMTGSGNDFVFLDGRETRLEDWPAERIQGICDRRTGVGADGIVILSPEGEGGRGGGGGGGGGGGEGGSAARMIYCNADGSRAGMCGNAALCSTRLAARLGLASETGMDLHTDTGVLKTRCVGPAWAAELQLPDFEVPVPVELPLEAGERWMDRCTVGVPHAVILVDDIDKVDVVARGKPLRHDLAFAPDGTNVNFLGHAKGAGKGDVFWVLRTYERGVEAETLACGTGTVAAAFALARRGADRLPIRIRSWGGNVFSVAGRIKDGRASEPWLCGEGRLVFEGYLRKEEGVKKQ